MYLAIIGDLVRSKHLSASDRRQVQQKLKDCLTLINHDYKASLASDFLITLGDEFQGLLKQGEPALEIIERIRSCLAEQKLRFGLGIGSIFTPIEATSIGADGPAYHLARQALETIKTRMRKSGQAQMSIRLAHERTDVSIINSLFSQLYYQEQGWTNKQQLVVWRMRTAQSQQELAKELKVSQPYINQVLQSTGYYTYRESLQTLSQALAELTHD